MSAWRIPSSGPARDLESEAKWRAIFGLSPIILCITGLEDGRIREVNETFLDTTGYTREEILGRTVTDLGLWLDLEQRERGMKSLQARTPIRGIETRFRMKNGEERVTVLAADVVMVDGQACILAALTDITDRKRAEGALRLSEERYRSLVEGVRDLIFALSPSGEVTSLNPAFEEITGFPPSAWIGRPFEALVHPEEIGRAHV